MGILQAKIPEWVTMSSSSLLLGINHQLPRAASLTSLTEANLIESRIHIIVIGANTGCLYSLRCVGGLACIEAIDDILG